MNPQDLTPCKIVSAAALPPEALRQAFVAAFADYLIGPFKPTAELWPAFLQRQGVDLGLSRAALRLGEQVSVDVLAFALVAPRVELGRWRLATMGALPAARGSGAAPALLDDFIRRAQAQGQAAVELEVFAQNQRALRLYQSRGFVARHELHGYQAEPGRVRGLDHPVQEIARQEQALAWLQQQAPSDLPLQVSPPILRQSALHSWRWGRAQLMFALQGEHGLQISSLLDASGPAQGDARVLLQTLAARYPARKLLVPALQRPDLGGEALRELGFERQGLHQLWMLRDLSGG
ncbi:ribosomal protein S18 acetylase RimI-like enzyme [Paucibacter oligotrophus]|uniref:Ribosomal protein S18 acetylase RimI-like enzyme n=1 Tax=Roseateles oligotrophus TaxID=1769250 RepID=A0A840L803_9BURK|nr:GNAT family N-acetyltransferase [Roseateles oligotrophus]MBB4842903.1 ribosomal protein S18 acetylase RimI-like enzyme [Roseateles oligotrophus]